MAVGSGLGGQLVVGKETVPGTPVTPTRAYEFTSENFGMTKQVVQGHGIRAGGLYDRAARRAWTTRDVNGTITMDFPMVGASMLLQQMFGGTGTIAQQAATAAWIQRYTPQGMTGQTLTVQKGVPQANGTVTPFTYNGVKIGDWTIACAVGGLVTLSLVCDAWDEVTATALATPVYPTLGGVWNFSQGALTLGGTVATTAGVTTITGGVPVAAVKGASIKATTGMATSRYFFNSNGRKAEQLENAYRATSGSLDAEFTSVAALYQAFAADSKVAMQLTFVGPLIASTYYYTLDIVIPAIYFDGAAPAIAGPDIVSVTVPFTALDDQVNPAIQLSYTSTDIAL